MAISARSLSRTLSFRFLLALGLAVLLTSSRLSSAQAGRFDLSGPSLDIHVTRGNRVLPIAAVPNLQPGDKLWLHPDLPATQSVHYLLIAAFLRGTTNPPPDSWFTKIETWNKKVRQEGVVVTVPAEAQQAILFLAPETGGDFPTLRSAVRGRPGTFVRASQDLAEAGFEQARIEKYIASMRQVPPSDPKALLDHSNLLARTLNLKPNEDCFKRSIELQYNCLTQSGTQTLLDDGHGQSVVASLTSGASSDFINAASTTSMAGGGLYSAYVGAIVDLVRITSGLHTAQYQYIPAIAFPEADALNLRLNTPPSFHNPKSVIVIGLPAIQAAVPPPLRPADPDQITCLLKPRIVLPVEGAPLVFSTSFAHDLSLHLNLPGNPESIPLTPDAYRGGLTLATDPSRKLLGAGSEPLFAPAPAPPLPPNAPAGTITGTISGEWGFDAFTGPTLLLQQAPGSDWKLTSTDPIVAGHENHITLSASATACIQSIDLTGSNGSPIDIKWKAADKPGIVNVTFPLKTSETGALHIAVHQYGDKAPATLVAQTYSEPATLSALELHAGDSSGIIEGKSLDQVRQMTIGNLTYVPAATPAPIDGSPSAWDENHLRMTLAQPAETPRFRVGERLAARVSLKDGRTLDLATAVLPARPEVTILGKSITSATNSPILLASSDDLPASSVLTFSLRSSTPFPRNGKIQIANADESLETTLTVAGGTLVLQNPHTLLATFDALKAFGPSAFGPLRLRAVSPDGTAGDWLPLATLVRLPTLTGLRCPADTAAPCTLSGSSLYLLDSLAFDQTFTSPTSVPDGFVDSTLSLPRPPGLPASLSTDHAASALLYLRLRDDSTSVDSITLPVLSSEPPAPKKDAPVSRKEVSPAAAPRREVQQLPTKQDAQPKPGVSSNL